MGGRLFALLLLFGLGGDLGGIMWTSGLCSVNVTFDRLDEDDFKLELDFKLEDDPVFIIGLSLVESRASGDIVFPMIKFSDRRSLSLL